VYTFKQQSTKKYTYDLLKCSINKSGRPRAVDYIGLHGVDPMTEVILVIYFNSNPALTPLISACKMPKSKRF